MLSWRECGIGSYFPGEESGVDPVAALADNRCGDSQTRRASRVSNRKVAAIIPAAGMGVRMGSSKKQFLKLDGVPILIHTLRKFAACPEVTEIFLAVPPGDVTQMQKMLASENLGKEITVVEGGA